MVIKRRYTNEERLQIIRMHTDAHDGVLRVEEFLESASNPSHPAHDWYEWDDTKAGHQWRIHQTRLFVHVTIQSEESTDITQDNLQIEIKPAMVSPLSERDNGGGFILTDTPKGEAALREEFAVSIQSWLNKRRGILTVKQISDVERAITSLHS